SLKDFVTIASIAGGIIGLIWSFGLTHAIQTIASLAVLILAVLVFLVIPFVQSRRPEFTIISLDKKLSLQDTEGRLAKFERKSREVANFDGLKELWFRNIAADGPIQNIKVECSSQLASTETILQLGLI